MAFGTYGPEARRLGLRTVRVKLGNEAISQMLAFNVARTARGIPSARLVAAIMLLSKAGECANTFRACLSSRAAFRCDRTCRRFPVCCVAARTPLHIMLESPAT